MKKRLTSVGNSLGLVIERPILALLDINRETELDISTDGTRLIIEPVREARAKRAASSGTSSVGRNSSSRRRIAR